MIWKHIQQKQLQKAIPRDSKRNTRAKKTVDWRESPDVLTLQKGREHHYLEKGWRKKNIHCLFKSSLKIVVRFFWTYSVPVPPPSVQWLPLCENITHIDLRCHIHGFLHRSLWSSRYGDLNWTCSETMCFYNVSGDDTQHAQPQL